MEKQIIQKIIQTLDHELQELNSFLLKSSKSNKTKLLSTIASHILSSGGKRIRPLVTIATYKLFNPNDKLLNQCFYLASSIEFIHSATLLHDDVVDNSNLRRNGKTANYIWGNKSSILVGDYLFSQSFKQMINTHNFEILEILADTSSQIAEAEVWQLSLIGVLDIKFHDYINLITTKTANLFSAACFCSAILSDASKQQQQALKTYGLNLGIIFQIHDDIRDYFCSSEALGKTLGSDFFEHKVTLPVIILLGCADNIDLKEITKILKEKNKTNTDFQQLLKFFNKYNVKEQSYKKLKVYIQKAIKDFDLIPQSKFKSLFLELIYSYEHLH